MACLVNTQGVGGVTIFHENLTRQILHINILILIKKVRTQLYISSIHDFLTYATGS